MNFPKLRAKSWRPDPEDPRDPPDSILLINHLRDVGRAADALLRYTGEDQLQAAGLASTEWRDRLVRIVRLAAALHDLGKANDHFQGRVWNQRGPDAPQAIRHEWIAVLLLSQTGWKEWMGGTLSESDDWDLMLWCIAGHHREPPPESVRDGGGSRVQILLGHADFRSIADDLKARFGLSDPPEVIRGEDTTWDLVQSGGPLERLTLWRAEADPRWDQLEVDDEQRRFLAVAKACLIAADVGGSAIPRTGRSIEQYVRDSITRVPSAEALSQIVADRLRPLDGGPVAKLRPFQVQMGASESRVTFVRAGCGSGKTLGAYHWAATRHPGKRLYFCYPTTGTATEGFRDYLFDPAAETGKFGANLFHGRARVDLELILGVKGDADDADEHLRIESLDAWSTPIVACTVDTVLGLVENHRRGLYAWPALAQAAFVFDEIHAYDDSLFNALLEFLTVCRGVPALLMTASLPRTRLEALRRRLRRIGEELLEPIPGPADLEDLPRYHRSDSSDIDVLDAIRDRLDHGGSDGRPGKVLWVLNTVDRAIAAFDRADKAGLAPMLYHSRYRYIDRVERHKTVMHAFRGSGPALAICTQLAEMSLDISADLLVTDLAPVPSLIQRLGRLNRRAKPPLGTERSPPTKPFVVIEPLNDTEQFAPWPYDPKTYGDWVTTARRWLIDLGSGSLPQTRLKAAWEAQDSADRFPTWSCHWVSSGPATEVGDLREVSPGLSVILDSDVESVRRGELEIIKVIVPMNQPPKKMASPNWPRVRNVPIAGISFLEYDTATGGRWRNPN